MKIKIFKAKKTASNKEVEQAIDNLSGDVIVSYGHEKQEVIDVDTAELFTTVLKKCLDSGSNTPEEISRDIKQVYESKGINVLEFCENFDMTDLVFQSITLIRNELK